jgi:hypothetical protein
MTMAGLDPAKAKMNVARAKTALKVAALKGKDGGPRWVGFAFAPGKDKSDHILVVDMRKKGPALMAEILKLDKTRKMQCCGRATVTKEGRPTLWVKYIKKLPSVERKLQEALVVMRLRYLVKQRQAEEQEQEQELEESEDDDAQDDNSDVNLDELGDDDDAMLENAVDPSEDEDAATAEAEDEEEEEQEEEEAPADSSASPAPEAPRPGVLPLHASHQVWTKTRSLMGTNVDKLKSAIHEHYSNDRPELMDEISESLKKLDKITETLDHRLAEALQKAAAAPDEPARKAELANAKAILTGYLKYVQSEPLIAHIDNNPFGVETNIKKVLTLSLGQLAKTVS